MSELILDKNVCGILPSGWVDTILYYLVLKMSSGTTEIQFQEKTNYPVSRIETISNEFIDFDKVRYLKKPSHDIIDKYQLEYGDILFSNINSDIHLGKTAIFYDDKLLIHGMNLLLIRPDQRLIFPKFLNFYFKHYRNLGRFISIAQHAVNQSSINQTKLKNVNFTLPPLNEQKRIVAKIEELFSLIDSLLQLLTNVKNQLKQYRHSLLDECIEGTIFYGNDTYPKKMISELIDPIGQGWSPKCENHASFDENDWAVIKTTAIQSLKFDYTQNKQLPATLKPRNHLELKEGDLLITRAGPRTRVGIACLIRKTRKRLLLCDKAYRIKCKQNLLDPAFLEILLNSPHITKEINIMKTGISDSGVNITQNRFSGLLIPFPPLNEQKRIATKVEEYLSFIEKNEKLVDSLLLQNNSLKNSILKQAFEGKLVPQDPNDESAEILLQKITEEKQKIVSQNKRGKRNDK